MKNSTRVIACAGHYIELDAQPAPITATYPLRAYGKADFAIGTSSRSRTHHSGLFDLITRKHINLPIFVSNSILSSLSSSSRLINVSMSPTRNLIVLTHQIYY